MNDLIAKDDIIMRLNDKNELISVENHEVKEVNLTGCEITAIAPEAFKDMKKLTHLIVGEGVREICEKAFWGCPLEELELPRSLKKIGPQAFGRIRTNFVRFSGSIDDWLEITRTSGFDIFGRNVILQCTDGDLSYGPLDYGK